MDDGRLQRIGLAVVLGIAAVCGSAAAPKSALPAGEPMAVEATPLVPLDNEAALSVVGMRGVISIETRDERELRVVSRELGLEAAERPVGIWQEGRTMIVAPAPGDRGGARQLHIEVPRGFGITVDAADSDVAILQAGGSIGLRGKGVRATVQGNGGSLSADLEGGSLTVISSSEAMVKTRGTAVTVATMSGNVTVRATGGSVSLSKIEGLTDVESEDCALTLEGLLGSAHVKSRKGEAKAIDSKGPIEFELAGTPLRLVGVGGDVTVTSDANVDFQALNASLRADLSGGALRGKGGKGSLDIRGRSIEINVETIENAVRIQGDGLKAKVADVTGDLSVEATLSDVVADRVAAAVVHVDRGNVTVQRAMGPVQITVVGGDVHVVDVTAAVTLDLDGGDADVSWASISGDKESKLVNKSGRITVGFPVSGACRVEAKSSYGRVDSSLPTVKVSDDLSGAAGPVNGGARPVVRVTASGDIHLQSSSSTNGLE